MIRQPRASHNSAFFRAWFKSAFDRFTLLVCQVLQQGSPRRRCMRDPPRRNFDVRLHFDTYVGQQSPEEAFSYAASYFSPVQLHPTLKSFRLSSKRTHPCSTACTVAGKAVGGKGASPQETRRVLLVGVIGDLMSTLVGVAAANLFSSLPTLQARSCRFVVPAGRNFPPRSCPPAGFARSFVMLAFFGA